MIQKLIQQFINNRYLPNIKSIKPSGFIAVEISLAIQQDDIKLIELFTQGTKLNQHYLKEVAKIIDEDIQDLKEHKNMPTAYAFPSSNDDNFTKKLYDTLNWHSQVAKIVMRSSWRNQQQLEVTAVILTQMKILLGQVGETDNRLEALVQKFQNANITLKERIVRDSEEMKEFWQDIEKQYPK